MQGGMGYVHITGISVPGEWNTFKAMLSSETMQIE